MSSKTIQKAEHDNKVVDAQGSEQQEPKTDADKKIRFIAEFLKRFGPFELVAIKAFHEMTTEGKSFSELEQTYVKSINHCLNAEATKESVANADEMVDHRMAKAGELLDKIEKYFTPKAYTRIAKLIMPIASNSKLKNEAFANLKSKPSQPSEDKGANTAGTVPKQG